MMTVDDAGAMFSCNACNRPPEPRLEALFSPKRGHSDVLAAERFAPTAFFIQAAERHRQLRIQPFDELEDESLRPARVQAENDLEHARRVSRREPHQYPVESQRARLRPPSICRYFDVSIVKSII